MIGDAAFFCKGDETMKRGTGAWWLVLAALLCSTGGVCIKLVPWSPLAVNGGRCAVAAGVTWLFLAAGRRRLRWNITVACGALSLALTTVFYAFATKLTSAACAVLLMYTSPIWVLTVQRLRGQRLEPRQVRAAAGVFLGLLFFVWDGLSAGRLLGNLLGLCSGVCYAGVFLFGADREGDAASSSFFGQLIGAAAGLPFLLLERDFSIVPLGCVIFLGVFQLGLSYVCMSKGLSKTSAGAASLITALEPLLSPVWVALFCGEMPGRAALPGMALVLASVLYAQLGRKNVKSS